MFSPYMREKLKEIIEEYPFIEDDLSDETEGNGDESQH
jgi:hypothetical protein